MSSPRLLCGSVAAVSRSTATRSSGGRPRAAAADREAPMLAGRDLITLRTVGAKKTREPLNSLAIAEQQAAAGMQLEYTYVYVLEYT